MKRFLFLLFILIPCLCYGQEQVARMSPMIVGGGVPAAASNGSIGQIEHAVEIDPYAGYYFFSIFTTTTAGTIGYGHIYVNFLTETTRTIELSLHDSSTGDMLCSGTSAAIITGGQWINVAMDSTCVIAGATVYWLAFQLNGDATRHIMGDSEVSWSVRYFTSAWESPAETIENEGQTGDGANNRLAIIFNNTAASPE